MTKELVQIIYLNGPSSSGKTTLAKALQQAFEEPFLHIGIDKIIGWMPEKVNDWTGGEAPLGYSWKKSEDASGHPIQELQEGPYAQVINRTLQEVALALAKMGHHIIIDDVSLGKEQLEEWKKILKDFRVLWIGVNAPLAVLEQREKERGNRILGIARGHFHKVHIDADYDLEIDTHQATLRENTEKIKSLALRPSMHTVFYFEPVKASQRALVHGWLAQPHIDEWLHGAGLQNTLNGLEKFFQGESDTTYWIGYDNGIPFTFLITSPQETDATTLDLFICDLKYLGKGIAVPMIQQFLISQFSHMNRILIDPEATNTRAIHVYQKVGFKIIGEFIASWHPVPHHLMELYMRDLLH